MRLDSNLLSLMYPFIVRTGHQTEHYALILRHPSSPVITFTAQRSFDKPSESHQRDERRIGGCDICS